MATTSATDPHPATEASICVTCGTQYPASEAPPAACPICEDDRQWPTLAAMRGHYHNRVDPIEPGVTGITTEPAFAIGQQAFLIETPGGNVLWETLTYVDETTVAEIQRRGGVAAIAISHPHYYATMVEWSRALGGVPIDLHETNRPWVMRPDPAVRYVAEDTRELVPGVTVLRCGGHFPGASVLRWAGGADGQGLLVSGDTIQVVADPRRVPFMDSYPNQIPLDPASVRRIVAAVAPYPFARRSGACGRHVLPDAEAAVRRSAALPHPPPVARGQRHGVGFSRRRGARALPHNPRAPGGPVRSLPGEEARMDDYQMHEVPGVIAPPPLVYAAGLGLGLLLDRARPAALRPALPRPVWRLTGAAFVAGGLGLGGWAIRTMQRAGTGPDPRHPATALVVDGPFRYSRNPIYAAMTAVYLGLTLLRQTLWPLLLLPALLVLIQRGVVEREERYLLARFGEAYRAYQARVRRWL
ncbi:MAG: methyltransferase [Sphaerobacter sp.]|nr:methyltransferase [Sphaerobacter sp.]